MSNGNATARRTRWTLGRAEKVLAIVVSILAILTFIFTFVISSPTLQTPVEDKFIATPMSFGQDMTLSVKKARTTDKGNITVFACSPDGHFHLMGDTAYGTAPDDFVMGGRYEADAVTLIINVTPEGGDPKTVISKWNLDGLTRTKPPVSRDGTLGCLDIRED